MERKAPDKAVNKSDKGGSVAQDCLARLESSAVSVDATAAGDTGGRVEGLAELLEDCSIERKVLLQPPGAEDTVRSTSETSENASSWRVFLRPCSSKRFPSSRCAFMLSLSSPSVETLVHIRRWVPAAGHQSLLPGCGQRNVLGECREGRSEAWLHVTHWQLHDFHRCLSTSELEAEAKKLSQSV